MVNISDIKAELKAWERDFKLQHGTQPTKSDINDCPTIAEKYRIYNRFRKDSGSQSQGSSVIRSAVVASSSSSTSAALPPPSSTHASTAISRASSASLHQKAGIQPALTSSPARPSTSNVLLSTPKKRRAPTQANPFLESPSRQSLPSDGLPCKATALPVITSPVGLTSSSFVFAQSPSKLRALISAHSSTGSPNDASSLNASVGDGWTPRTRARKRLRGETTGSPHKAVRRKVASSSPPPGSSRGRVRGGGLAVARSRSPTSRRVDSDDDSDNDAAGESELLGPSPVKPDDLAARPRFQLQSSDSESDDIDGGSGPERAEAKRRRKSTPRTSVPRALFGDKILDPSKPLLVVSVPPPAATSRASGLPASARNPFLSMTTPKGSQEPAIDIRRRRSPPLDYSLSQSGPSKKSRTQVPVISRGFNGSQGQSQSKAKAEKALAAFSHGAGEDDASSEAEGPARIVPSHLLVSRGRIGGGVPPTAGGDSSDENSLSLGYPSPAKRRPIGVYGLPLETSHPILEDAEGEGVNLPPRLLSVLSLRSPESASAKLAREMSHTFNTIFAEADERRSRSKGEPVWEAGEIPDDDGEGDDDWASETEGWKETGLGVDDGVW